MFNPYVKQVAAQTGMTEHEVNRVARRSPITLEAAQSRGFDSVAEYEEALHEFLNSNWTHESPPIGGFS